MEVSNPDKVIFPEAGLTKRDLVGYYERVAEVMLPHIKGRPLTLQRFPNGIDAKGFMQKNVGKHFPEFIERVPVTHQSRETVYAVIHDAEGLCYLANQGTVTFHIWTTRQPELHHPDHIVFDLDPPKGGFEGARAAAKDVRAMLDELSIESVVCATGSSGYHVVFPVRPDHDLAEVGRFCRLVAELLSRRHPDRLTTEFRKKNRKGRVFVDWLRNRPGQTVACPWTLRPRPGAPFVVPLDWDELDDTAPDDHRLAGLDRRLDHGDPYAKLSPIDLSSALADVTRRAEEAEIELVPFDRFRS